MQRVWQVGSLALALGVFSCGRPGVPSARPPAARVWVADISPSAGLRASRLSTAGCIQWVHGETETAEFSSASCPGEGKLVAKALVKFSLTIRTTEAGSAELLLAGIPVGKIDEESGTDGKPWVVRHLCQLSDPEQTPQKPFAELCRVRFQTETGEEQGRYQSVALFTLEEVAQSKLDGLRNIGQQDQFSREKALSLDRAQQALREELRRAGDDRQAALEALADARRGIQQSFASSVTAKRALERTEAEAALRLAEAEARYVESEIRFANSERRRAALLKDRLAAAEGAERLEKSARALLSSYERAGVKTSDEITTLLAVLDQNKLLLLTEDQKREMAQEISFATGEAERLVELEGKKSPASLRLVNDKKDALERLLRLPPETPNNAPPTGKGQNPESRL